MRPTSDQLIAACPQVDRSFIDQHLRRLGDAYFAQFSLNQIAAHITALSHLSPDEPVQVIVHIDLPGQAELTVLCRDYPGVFSLITGTLAGIGLSIETGNVFTYRKLKSTPHRRPNRWLSPIAARRRRTAKPSASDPPAPHRHIIDHFTGVWVTRESPHTFAQRLTEELKRTIGKLETDPMFGGAQALHRTNEMVTRRLRKLTAEKYPLLYPVELDIRSGSDGLTHMRIIAQDTPAFLYSLSNALAMMGMSIEAVGALTHRGMIEDDIGFVDRNGHAVTDPRTLNRVRLVVLLTKQFTYHLGKAPDPYTALSRFERIVEDVLTEDDTQQWMAMLSEPGSMRKLARLLGASDYLWEDFIRVQYRALLPILQGDRESVSVSHDSQSITQRLTAELARAATPSEKKKALNRFKDEEVFLIDLDQILQNPQDFRAFSGKLTALADAVVTAAATLAYEHIADQHGRPIDAATAKPCPWTVCGLGKLGGEALGYASDIELLFLYDGSGQTDGRDAIHVGEFFNLLAREVGQIIQAKQEGIFRVDLRVRPYGKNAPLAVSLETMRKYYGPGGDGLAWERLALVRLRPICGDESFGQCVSDLRDALVYSAQPLALDELWQMRRLQWQQKKRATGEFNAKYSPGGLVDVEYAVQILQVTGGHEHVALRTPRIHQALAALVEANLLEGDDTIMLGNAYRFMRELINGLRMLRGSAKDLFVPEADEPAYVYLSRRLGYEGPEAAGALTADLAYHANAVKQFIVHCFGAEALADRTSDKI